MHQIRNAYDHSFQRYRMCAKNKVRFVGKFLLFVEINTSLNRLDIKHDRVIMPSTACLLCSYSVLIIQIANSKLTEQQYAEQFFPPDL